MPKNKTPKQLAKQYGIPEDTVTFLRGLPNYDPFAQADGYTFDMERASMWLQRFPLNIVHAKGRLVGQPFKLSPWQRVQIANFYGWYNAQGFRRYNYCFEYVAKKNGKTAKTAAWLMLELRGVTEADKRVFGDKTALIHVEEGAELYSAASSRDQAAKVFEHAAGMALRNEAFGEGLTVLGAGGGSQARVISNRKLLSSYKCLAADANTADGSFPYLYVEDEIHRHKSPELCTVLENSAAAHDQPIGIGTTTADYARESICNEKLAFARRVCENKGDASKPGFAPWFLPVVYEITPDQYTADRECFRKPKYWRMANPNLDVTVTESAMFQLLQKADEQPSTFNDFLRLHCNIVTEGAEKWVDVTQYDAAQARRSLDELDKAICYGGLDLSNRQDITALVLAFPDDEYIDLFGWYWIPQDAAEKAEKSRGIPYSKWARDGWITITEGNSIDHRAVRDTVIELSKRFALRNVAHDPWNSAQLATELMEGEGIEMLQFRQGMYTYNEPTKETERLIATHKLRHGNDPVLRWAFSNTQIKRDNNSNIMPDKGHSADKIDPACAAIMAVGANMRDAPEPTSIYEERGLLVL